MDNRNESKGSNHLPSRALGYASDSDLAGARSGKQRHQGAAPFPPSMTRNDRLFNKLAGRSPCLYAAEHYTYQPISASASQSLAVSASTIVRPHSSYSETSARQIHRPPLRRPLTAGGIVTAGGNATLGGYVTPGGSVVSGGDITPARNVTPGGNATAVRPNYFSSPGSPFAPASTPIIRVSYSPTASYTRAPPPTRIPYTPTPTQQAPAPAKTKVHAAVLPQAKPTLSPSHASVVWARALEITRKKLSENNLPPINLTNLTSQSAEENIEAVVKGLNTLQENDKKKRWTYTWRGKKVIVVERLGKILKSVERYSKIVDTAIQSNPQVAALVWAGVWAIMRVRI